MTDDDVTLGEVNRNVVLLREDLREIAREFVNLKTLTSTNSDRVRRLEMIVYGTGAMSTAALVTAAFSILTGK